MNRQLLPIPLHLPAALLFANAAMADVVLVEDGRARVNELGTGGLLGPVALYRKK